MGYDIARFQGEIHEDFICPICSDVLEEPLQAPQCEHAFCKACINEWLKRQPSCPIDRKPISELKPIPRIVRNLLSDLLILCDNATLGCTVRVKLERLDVHREECEYNPKRRIPPQQELGDKLSLKNSKGVNIRCRSIRIGSFRIHPVNTSLSVFLSMDGISFSSPIISDSKEIINITLKFSDVTQMLVHFGRLLPMMFVFTTTNFAEALRGSLNMSTDLFDPTSSDQTKNKITFLIENSNADNWNAEQRQFLENTFVNAGSVKQIDLKTANGILVKSTPPQIIPSNVGFCPDGYSSGDASSEDSGSDSESDSDGPVSTEVESAHLQTEAEEELQLQLALAMSIEEAKIEEAKSKEDFHLQLALAMSSTEAEKERLPRDDDLRLQMALTKSLEINQHSKSEDKEPRCGNPLASFAPAVNNPHRAMRPLSQTVTSSYQAIRLSPHTVNQPREMPAIHPKPSSVVVASEPGCSNPIGAPAVNNPYQAVRLLPHTVNQPRAQKPEVPPKPSRVVSPDNSMCRTPNPLMTELKKSLEARNHNRENNHS